MVRALAVIVALLSTVPIGATPADPGNSRTEIALREAMTRIAHLEELCRSLPTHAECAVESWQAACHDLRVGRHASSVGGATEPTVTRYVADVMSHGSCASFDARPPEGSGDRSSAGAELPTDEPTDDESLTKIVEESHRHLEAAADAFRARIVAHVRRIGPVLADLRRGIKIHAELEENTELDIRDIDGEPVDSSGYVEMICEDLVTRARKLTARYQSFHADFGSIPGARFEIDRLGAQAHNALASTLVFVNSFESCDPVATADWWLGQETVKPGQTIDEPPDVQSQRIGTTATPYHAGAFLELTREREKLEGRCAEICPPPIRDAGCARILAFVSEARQLFAEVRQVSRGDTYHFVRERFFELELLQEIFLSTSTLSNTCDADGDLEPLGDDYLRYAVEVVRLIDPDLEPLIRGYIDSRYDTDFRKEL